jgi:cytoskeletal protein CcmA (bactofilin family)
MKKISLILTSFIMMFLFINNANAVTFKSFGDYAAFDDNFSITRDVDGDIYTAGETITINSNVKGDIIGAANSVSLTGNVENNIRMAGNTLNFSKVTANSITVAGSKVSLTDVNANKIYVAGEKITFTGKTNYLNAIGSEVTISGELNGKSYIRADKVIIEDTAVIKDTLKVKAAHDIVYNGDVNKDNIVYTHVDEYEYNYSLSNRIADTVYGIIATYIIIVLMILFMNGFIDRAVTNLKEKKVSTVLFGLFLFLVTPIIILLTLITFIGIPVSIITLFAYITFILTAKAFASISLGKLLFKDMNLYLSSLIGIMIFTLLSFIPVVNVIVWFTYIGYVFGSYFLMFKKEK